MDLSPRSGFSLTELVVSIVLFSVGILGFATAVGMTSSEILLGGRDTHVAMLALDQMERLKALGHDGVTDGERTEGPYTLRWDVEGAQPRRIRLIVSYPALRGGDRSDTLIAYIAR